MMLGSSISRAFVKFKAERGLGTVRGGRSLRVSCFVRSVVPSHDRLKVWPEIAGELNPARGHKPTNALPQPDGGKFGIDFHHSVVSEPSWLDGAEPFGPPEL